MRRSLRSPSLVVHTPTTTHPERSDSGKNSRNSFQDKQPTPTGQTTDAVHVGDRKRNDARKGTGDARPDIDERPPRSTLVLAVPEPKVENDARSETTFKQTEKDAAGDERGKVEGGAHECGADAPGDGDARDLDRGFDAGEEQVGREFGEDVADEEDRDGDVVVVSGQACNERSEVTSKC